MKTITVLSGMLLLFTTSAFAELSGTDLEKIRAILKEEVAEVETRLTEKITTSEKHLKEYVSQEIGKVNIKIEEMDKRLTGEINNMDERLTGEINNMDERLDQMFTLVVVLITTVIAVIGVPMTIILFQLSRQDKKQRSQDEIIEALRQELEERNQGSIITP